jgi:hypothetical protein
MVLIKKAKVTNVGKGTGKGALIHCWLECKLVQPLWKSLWRCFKNLEIELAA